ncbi:UV radiation resistance protein and autophagy-related subunit 14-domain-containing protein [Xylariales sp. PMI_506]|nr:UV radiation resistance protein and autophagy-related subunit 14-domain-containing protein [Xylariales sp. PMI_506]
MSLTTESSRPILLPQNRRLRHLQGIYLRNLSFVRPSGKSTDDLELNIGSPTKLQLLKSSSSHQLQHAASSESLRQRPGKPRRRSTNLANKSPVTRQKHLESTIESRAADAFFSLHVEGVEGPVYISELAERSMNFNFRFFDLSQADPLISRSSELTIKIWTRRNQAWSFLLSQTVTLSDLSFIGTLRNQQYPPNCIVFHLVDGIYTLGLPAKIPEAKRGLTLPTSPYNALMKLCNLEASVQDALATRDTLTNQINEILDKNSPDILPQAEEKAHLAQKYVAAEERAIRLAEIRRDQLKLSIAARRAAIAQGREAQGRAAEDVEHASTKLPASRDSIDRTRDEIRGQRRRICDELAQIFPITSSPSGAPLAFQICGLDLPNTDYDPTISSAAEEALSAALGMVAQLTNALQLYLGIPLPYPVTPFGSRSSIRDDISQISDTQRSFPLFLRGSATSQYRFDYGWFLLNKNIETLCASAGLKVVDIRHTLPNLKYLLYVCSAGTDELPERKRGGVRGLWAGKLRGKMNSMDDGASSTAGSRRGSAESELAGKQRDELRRALSASNGNGNGYRDLSSLVIGGTPNRGLSPARLPFDEGTKLTLRTKGLRENVVK